MQLAMNNSSNMRASKPAEWNDVGRLLITSPIAGFGSVREKPRFARCKTGFLGYEGEIT